jgi:hypothetical protein
MTLFRWLSVLVSYVALTVFGASLATADSIFTFETNSQGQTGPFTDTVGGLSATFTGQASVCNITGLGFVMLSGNALIQDFCVAGQSGPLSVSFSGNLSSISLDFATAGGAGTLTLNAFENGAAAGTSTFSSSVPPAGFDGEGLASFSGLFNSLTLTSSDVLALDNVDAALASTTTGTPEPSSIGAAGLGAGFLLLLVYRRRSGSITRS